MIFDETRGKRPMNEKVFSDKLVRQAYKLTLLGYSDKDMSLFFEVDESTIHWWKRNRPEFLAAITKGKDEADAKVAHAMYKRAIGYSHPDTHITTSKDGDGKTIVLKTPITKHYPPDVTAGFKWLERRQRGKWSEAGARMPDKEGQMKQEELSAFSDKELEFMKSIGMKSIVSLNPKHN